MIVETKYNLLVSSGIHSCYMPALHYRRPNGAFYVECFTTSFLYTNSWLNWVDEDDEDEVGLKEK